VTFSRSVLVGLKDSPFRGVLDGWVRSQGLETYVTDRADEAVAWVRERPEAVAFVDRDLARLDGVEVWRVVRPIVSHRLVLMARQRTRDLWFSALAEGVGSVLTLPTEREVVLTALRLAAGR
jgi:DNA-binding NtrC family response regulator